MRPDIRPGGTFPDYQLLEHTGREKKLSEVQGDDPMVLVLCRGNFCPNDHWQHRRLVEFFPELVLGHVRIATVTNDDLRALREMRLTLNAHWPFFSDTARIIQRDLDIQEYTDPEHDPMIPHTLVLEPGLKIFSVYNGYFIWGRPTIEQLRCDLRDICSRIRPDWDLSAPGLRKAWESGDRTKFHPYR